MAASDMDPFIRADADNRSAQVVQVETLGRGGIAVILLTVLVSVVLAALSYGLAGRAMDRAQIAERETRITQEDMKVLRIALVQKGIVLEDVDHP